MQEANELLQQAEAEDGYRTRCKRDPLNAAARANTSYIPWNDQTDARRYEQMLKNPSIRCVIMHPTADGGMPHTRGSSLICIPAYWSSSSIASTLRHELVHIEQKRKAYQWKQKVLQEGWEPDVAIPWEVARRCRLNPDTIGCRFAAWEGRYVPVPLFVREDRPSLKEVQVRWYDLEEERTLLDPPYSFIKRYGNPSDSEKEHPFELYAYRLQ